MSFPSRCFLVGEGGHVVEDEGDLEVELFGGVSDAEFADFAEDEREILRSSGRTTGWSQQGWRWQAQMHGNPHG